MTRETNKSQSNWPFPAANEHQRPQDRIIDPTVPAQPVGDPPADPVEQELVDEQLTRDRETARRVSPPRS